MTKEKTVDRNLTTYIEATTPDFESAAWPSIAAAKCVDPILPC